MKRMIPIFLVFAMLLAGCGKTVPPTPSAPAQAEDETYILLSNHGSTVDGKEIGSDSSQAVYAANDIIYYEAGHDFTYGEGTPEEEHSPEEAAEHTVIHITQPGTYRLSGTLNLGQIAVDLGEDAKDDPTAVVTLILDGMSIKCTVAPAIIFYNVYECGSTDDPTMDVDTSAAGANIIIAGNDTENTIKLNEIFGSHVARIYKSYTLSEDGSEVIDSKKLHKYDGALYSRMSMNISAEEDVGRSILNISADNEGLDTEMHLTLNGGEIHIRSGNDGINTNEDGVSVTTVNGGHLSITVAGTEGDGIDSNGWLVINAGLVEAYACGSSMDSGIDADNGVYINGGTVIAAGNMLDRLQGSQTYAVFSFTNRQTAYSTYQLKNEQGETVFTAEPGNQFSNLVISSPELVPGTYTFWCDNVQLGGIATEGGFGGMPGGMFDSRPPQGFGGFDGQPPEGFEGFDGQPPEDFEAAPYFVYPVPGAVEGATPPEDGFNRNPPEHSDGFGGFAPPDGFEGGMKLPDGRFSSDIISPENLTGEFEIKEGANFFGNVYTLPAN